MADIELVIKIPEEIYEASQIIDAEYEDVIQIPLEVIKNGTLLPKGHGRLIDASAVESEMDEQFAYITSPLLDHVQVGQFYQLLYGAPTIIEADTESEEE